MRKRCWRRSVVWKIRGRRGGCDTRLGGMVVLTLLGMLARFEREIPVRWATTNWDRLRAPLDFDRDQPPGATTFRATRSTTWSIASSRRPIVRRPRRQARGPGPSTCLAALNNAPVVIHRLGAIAASPLRAAADYVAWNPDLGWRRHNSRLGSSPARHAGSGAKVRPIVYDRQSRIRDACDPVSLTALRFVTRRRSLRPPNSSPVHDAVRLLHRGFRVFPSR